MLGMEEPYHEHGSDEEGERSKDAQQTHTDADLPAPKGTLEQDSRGDGAQKPRSDADERKARLSHGNAPKTRNPALRETY